MLHYIESVDGQFPIQTATHSFTILGPTVFAANAVSHRQTSIEYNDKLDGPAYHYCITILKHKSTGRDRPGFQNYPCESDFTVYTLSLLIWA